MSHNKSYSGIGEAMIFVPQSERDAAQKRLDAGELVDQWLAEEGLTRWDLIDDPRLDELFDKAMNL